MVKELIKELLKGEFQHNSNDNFENTDVFHVATEELKMTIWNSCNNNSIDEEYVGRLIANDLLDDDSIMDGDVDDGFNNIMFEIIEL